MLGKDSSVTSIAAGQFQKHRARNRGVATISRASASLSANSSSFSAGDGARCSVAAVFMTPQNCGLTSDPSIRQPADALPRPDTNVSFSL